MPLIAYRGATQILLCYSSQNCFDTCADNLNLILIMNLWQKLCVNSVIPSKRHGYYLEPPRVGPEQQQRELLQHVPLVRLAGWLG